MSKDKKKRDDLVSKMKLHKERRTELQQKAKELIKAKQKKKPKLELAQGKILCGLQMCSFYVFPPNTVVTFDLGRQHRICFCCLK